MFVCLFPVVTLISFQFQSYSLDFDGNVNRIKYSVPQRDSFFSIDPEKVYEWYAALKIFVDLLYDEAIYFKMEPGIHFINRISKKKSQ